MYNGFVSIKQTIARLKTKYTPTYERWLAKPVVQLVVRITNRMGNTATGDLAASIAFNIILSILPLLFGALALFAYFFNTADLQSQILKFFMDNLPSAVGNLQDNLNRIANARAALGLFGVLGSLWTGMNVFGTLNNAINRTWGVTRFRPFFHAKLLEIAMIIGSGLLLILSMGFSAAVKFLPDVQGPLANDFVQFGAFVVAFMLMFIIFLVTYKVFPHTRTTWREVFPGALLAAVAFELGRQFFFLFAGNTSNLLIIYGSLATAILFLIWIYYAAMITLIGAIFTAELDRLRREIREGRFRVVKPGDPNTSG
jgi:membrane protein